MILKIITSAAAIFIAIIIHEIAHGWMAWRLGDTTAKESGRLSINPLKHIDLFGTIILPIILFLSKTGLIFGWAKPVPVNYNNLGNRKRNIILVASAGIIANLLLAILSSIMLKLSLLLSLQTLSGILAMFWLNMILFNIVLAVFNLIPIPPLDGSKILLGWSNNPRIQNFLNSERAGLLVIILLIFILPTTLALLDINFNPFSSYMRQTSLWLANWLI